MIPLQGIIITFIFLSFILFNIKKKSDMLLLFSPALKDLYVVFFGEEILTH